MNEKLEFSEELLSPLTPQRGNQEYPDPVTTAKKVIPPTTHADFVHTPASNKGGCERGLKNLASEAYRFVAQQRRSSYKEVAMSMVLQREDYDSVQRKG